MHIFAITKLLAAFTITSLAAGSALPDSLTSIRHTATNSSQSEWFGPSQGKNITLYGTASEVMAQLKELDPDWVPATLGDEVDVHSLEARSEGTLTCCPVGNFGWEPCSFADYLTTAEELAQVGGSYIIQPNSCQIVSGYNNCGIWICDSDHNGGEAWSVRRTTIAQYSTSIQDKCNQNKPGPACGQLFAKGQSWNVIIHTYSVE